jgi:hypothetical protein
MAITCCAGIEVVEARVPVASAEAAVAWDDLPASVACPAVICLEDLAADRAEPALEQVMEGLANDRISGIVLHVGTPLSVQVGSALHRRPDLFSFWWVSPLLT